MWFDTRMAALLYTGIYNRCHIVLRATLTLNLCILPTIDVHNVMLGIIQWDNNETQHGCQWWPFRALNGAHQCSHCHKACFFGLVIEFPTVAGQIHTTKQHWSFYIHGLPASVRLAMGLLLPTSSVGTDTKPSKLSIWWWLGLGVRSFWPPPWPLFDTGNRVACRW